MASSGYYDEIGKVEALRRQQRWQFRRRHAVHTAKRLVKRTDQQSDGIITPDRKRSAI